MKIAKHRWMLLLAFIVVLVAVFGYQLIAVRGTFAPSRPVSGAGGSAVLLGSPDHRIAGRVYVSGMPNPAAPIVVVLHGDAPFVNPGYQYAFASNLSDKLPGTRVVALLRPGYADPYGAKSDGNRGFATGENYTPDVLNDVAAAIYLLKSQWKACAVILIGHSGGATIAADIAALNPGLVQHVFLIGCPCDVPAFRLHMAQLQWSPMWLLPVHSISPIRTLDRMQKSTKVTAISGANDPIALPQYARTYISKAKAQGLSASLIEIPGKGHEILNDPVVVKEIANAVRNCRHSADQI